MAFNGLFYFCKKWQFIKWLEVNVSLFWLQVLQSLFLLISPLEVWPPQPRREVWTFRLETESGSMGTNLAMYSSSGARSLLRGSGRGSCWMSLSGRMMGLWQVSGTSSVRMGGGYSRGLQSYPRLHCQRRRRMGGRPVQHQEPVRQASQHLLALPQLVTLKIQKTWTFSKVYP